MMTFTRKIDLLGFLLGCAVLGLSYYLEIYAGLKPCPLCTVQRFILLVVIFLFFFGALMPLQNFARRFYHLLVFFVASSGVAVAARHVWLTLQPADQIPSCAASISLLMQYLPLKEVAKIIFQGGGDCHLITWRFLSLSLPEWSLLGFIVFTLIAILQMFSKDRL